MPSIVSIQLALPRTLGEPAAALSHDKLWTTGFFKLPVAEPVYVSQMNIVGDGQADLENHGGIDKAVLAYSADHYAFWRQELKNVDLQTLLPAISQGHHSPLPDLLAGKTPCGSFGENLSVNGLDETGVCIGDTWRAGEVVFQVSQPRQPCWKLSRRWRIADLAKRVIQNGKSGWYFRVLVEGVLEAGTELVLDSRPFPDWTVARASTVMHHQKDDLELNRQLAALPLLSASWQETLSERVARHVP